MVGHADDAGPSSSSCKTARDKADMFSIQGTFISRTNRSLNAVFGHIGRSASEEVVIHLITQKCLPILLDGTEACPLNKSDRNLFDFAVNQFLMNLFKTNNTKITEDCRNMCGVCNFA